VKAAYRDSGSDAYPDILARAPVFFEKEPGYSAIWEYVKKTGKIPETEGARERLLTEITSAKPWADRGLFRVILERFHLLPITVDSHLGEYISWAYDAVDHKGIIDFYTLYRQALSQVTPTISGDRHEKGVTIVEGILEDRQYIEEAVNLPNRGLIPGLPEDVAVEVPALIGSTGARGLKFPDYPKGFAALLRNYTGVYDLTAEAALRGSRELVIQALLVNPIVTEWRRLEELVDVMLDRQRKWLGYIR